MRNLHLLPLSGFLFASLAAYAEPAAEKLAGLDGAALYAEHCIECHGRATISPSLTALSNMTAEEIHKELWFGVMAQFANGLDDAKRWTLAKWIADHKPEKGTRGAGVTMCKDKTPLVLDAEYDWPGLSKDNRYNRHVTNAQFTAAGLANLKVKWAVAFPQVHAFKGGGHSVAVVGDRIFVGNYSKNLADA